MNDTPEMTFLDKCKKVDLWATAILLLTVIVMVLVQVGSRWVGSNVPWPSELGRYANILLVFLILPRITRSNTHLKVTFFYDLFPEAVKKVVTALTQLMSLLMVSAILYAAMISGMRFWDTRSSAANFPMVILYIAVAVSMFAMLIIFVFNLIDLYKRIRINQSEIKKL